MEGINYEDNYVKFTFKEGILYAEYKVSKIDLDVAKHVLVQRLMHYNKYEYSLLADYTVVKETSKEARDFFASPEATKFFKSIAVLTNSLVGNMIYNFYIILSKPSIPTKLFNDKEEAIRWLKEFHQNH